MATRPDPYLKKNPGDIMLASDWNEMQALAREELHRHGHTGGDDAPPIDRAGIAPNAVDGSRIHPDADVSIKALKVNGRTLLAEIDQLIASVKGLTTTKFDRAGDTINGSLKVTGLGQFAGDVLVKGDLHWSNSILRNDQGGSLELGGTDLTPGVGLPYIDFHFKDKKEDFNVRIINDGDGQLTIQSSLFNVLYGRSRFGGDVSIEGNLQWSSSTLKNDHGGSLELGGTATTPGAGTPYIDFHFKGKTEDFNTRIINDADGQLTVSGNKLNVTKDLIVGGQLTAKSMRLTHYLALITKPFNFSTTNTWGNIAELNLTITLTQPTSIYVEYEVSANSGSGKLHLVTRLLVDNIEKSETRSISGDVQYWANRSHWSNELPAGTHTFQVQYRTPSTGATLSPSDDWQKGTLTALVFGA